MHDWLAQVYGTGEMEKTAGEELLEQFAAEAGVDVDDLSDEERQELSAELEEVASGYEAAGDEGDEGDEYEEGDADEGEDEEAIEKFAEADFLGRVMAHSMTQELQKIANETGDSSPSFLGKAKDLAVGELKRSPGDLLGTHGRSLKGMAKKDVLKALAYGGGTGSSAGNIARTIGKRLIVGGSLYGAKKLKDKMTKKAFSVTRSGHKLDAKEYGAISKALHDIAKAEGDYADDNPAGAFFTGRHGTRLINKLRSRHADYAARKHEDNRNAFNPLGGILTKSRHEAQEKKAFDEAFDAAVEERAIELLGQLADAE